MAGSCGFGFAAAILALQFLAAVVSLSSTAYLINNYDKGDSSLTNVSESSVLRWPEAWVPLSSVWYTAFASVWIVSIFLASLAFCFPTNISLIPNIVVLLLGMLMDLLVFGVCLGYILKLSSSQRTSTIGRITVIYNMGLMGLVLLIMFVSLISMCCIRSKNEEKKVSDEQNQKMERIVMDTVAEENITMAPTEPPPVIKPVQEREVIRIPNRDEQLNRFYDSEIINT